MTLNSARWQGFGSGVVGKCGVALQLPLLPGSALARRTSAGRVPIAGEKKLPHSSGAGEGLSAIEKEPGGVQLSMDLGDATRPDQ